MEEKKDGLRRVGERPRVPYHLPSFLPKILDSIADPVFAKDESHRWVYLNRAACDFIGHSREELLGKSDFDFFPREEAATFWEMDDRVLRTGETCENEERFTGPAGLTRIISTKKSLFVDEQGRPLLVGVIRDLTHIKETEKQLVETLAVAREANQAKTKFVANVSHEIRTPLNGILGMADLVLDGSLDAPTKEKMLALRESANHLLYLVNDILDFSSLGGGKFAVQLAPFDPRKLVESIRKLFAPTITKGNQELVVDICDAIPRELVGDRNRIRQVIENLVGNASKFTPTGGRIELNLKTLSKDESWVQLLVQVKDTGRGVPEDKLEDILEPFVQLESEGRGTGLGLAIVKQLVDLLRGELRVESVLGKGSTFSLELALGIPACEQAELKRCTSAKVEEFPGLRVLVVEDDKVSRKVAAMTLAKLSCKVSTACDGVEALELTAEEDVDFILLDCQMPRMNGYEFCEEFRRLELDSGRKRVPIAALTAHVLDEDRRRCLAAGMDNWLTKPLRRDELIEILQGHFVEG